MLITTRLSAHDFIWLGATLLVVSCLSLTILLTAVQQWLPDLALPAGTLAAVCVEWGRNWAGQTQIGLWWESSHLSAARPRTLPGNTLKVVCGYVPWARAFPTRGIFIHTW
jgi:hypothetical protein